MVKKKRFILITVIGFIVFFILNQIAQLNSKKGRFIPVANSQYLFSQEAQKYFRIYDTSGYEAKRFILIIEEPHYSQEGQFSLYKGLEVFFRDNPALIDKTIFLSEGSPAGYPISTEPLIKAKAGPSEELIKEVLGSFLIPGYVAYEWRYQKDIPILGVEDEALYQLSRKLWIEMREQKDSQQIEKLWCFTVAARNKCIAKTLIEKAKSYDNPILFVGGLHIRKHNYNLLRQIKRKLQQDYFKDELSREELGFLNDSETLSIYDYLKREKIGYTFLVPVQKHCESSKEAEKNISIYTELFKTQQNGNYIDYINWLISKRDLGKGITVAASPAAASVFVAATSAAGSSSSNDKDKDGQEKKKQKGEKEGQGGTGEGGFDSEQREDQEDNDWYYHWDEDPHDKRDGKRHWDRGNKGDGTQEWSPDGTTWFPK